MLILCNGVNVGFWRRSSARTINSQLATIWKILGDLCHILWRLFTIARPTYFRCQFVVDYWQHITFIGRIRRESTDKYKYKIQNTYAKTNAQHLPKYLRCHFVVIGNTSLLLTECRGNKEPTTKQVMQKQILTCQSILTGDMSLARWYWHGADKVTSQEHGIWNLVFGQIKLQFSWPENGANQVWKQVHIPICYCILTWVLPGLSTSRWHRHPVDRRCWQDRPGLQELLSEECSDEHWTSWLQLFDQRPSMMVHHTKDIAAGGLVGTCHMRW